MATCDLYAALAPYYDRLMVDVSYPRWADYVQAEIQRWGRVKTVEMLDLACGTGRMTLELARRGYDMVGVDNSEEMLGVARELADKDPKAGDILWLLQDMTELDLYGTVDAAVCCLDAINHLTEEEDVRKTLSLVHNFLVPDGLFMFDLNTPYKFEHQYADMTYVLEDKRVFCVWQNHYRKRTGLCDFFVTLFERGKDGRYDRLDTLNTERVYSERKIRALLKETGFELLSLAGDLDGSPATATTPRWYITARAIKP